jgi:hypothetical protein
MRAWRDRTTTLRLAATVALVAAVAIGLGVLGDAVSWLVPAALVAFGVVATVPFLARNVPPALFSAVVGAVALVGFNVPADFVVRLVDADHAFATLGIAVGLVTGLLVFGFASYWYLRGSWAFALSHPADSGTRKVHVPSPRWPRKNSAIVAGSLAVLFILVVPPVVGLLREDAGRAVPASQRVASQLDVLLVAAGPYRAALPELSQDSGGRLLTPYAHAAELDIRYAVGFAAGDGIRWSGTDTADEREALAVLTRRPGSPAPAPVPRPGADVAVVLLVDPIPPAVEVPRALDDAPRRSGEVRRWRRIARAAARPGTATFALLRTRDEARLDAWKAFGAQGAFSVQRLNSQTVTDAAVRLAVAAPTAQEDFLLALRHRPVLLFDDGEPVPRPLSVRALFEAGKVRLCRDGRRGTTRCDPEPVRRAADLVNGGTHLELDLPGSRALRRRAFAERDAVRAGLDRRPAADGPAAGAPAAPVGRAGGEPLGAGSVIYVHPVPAVRNGRQLLYLDYWWYLPDNPSGSGKGAFCGAGLVVPGISCFDHVSDWEGVTVVVDRTDRVPEVLAVHYAQHDSVVRHAWPDLQERWGRDPTSRRLLTSLPDARGQRPLVYVARGTHASYATPCLRSTCRQVAHDLEEQRHNGRLPWIGDYSGACGRVDCLQLLPTGASGRAPALWNAFAGAWGRRRCLLVYYCDSSSPPAAPGRQARYRDPARVDVERKP